MLKKYQPTGDAFFYCPSVSSVCVCVLCVCVSALFRDFFACVMISLRHCYKTVYREKTDHGYA